jgi:glucose-6-phosphate dehydrogenase assembly protein OpcA
LLGEDGASLARRLRFGALFMLNTDMSRWELDCQIQGNEIIVSMPDTGWSVTFYKSANSPQLLARAREKERGGVMGEADFFARAWNLANDKARELGWIV